MNKSKKNDKIVTACIIILILIITGLVFAFWPPVAYFNKEFYVTVTTEELDLQGIPSDWPMYYLQFFHKLKKLHLYEPKEDDLKYIPDTKTLTDISMSFTDITDASAVKAFVSTEKLHFLGSKFNFEGFGSNTIKDLSFQSCGLYNFDKHGSFPNLEELRIYNCFFDKEDFVYNMTMNRSTPQAIKDTGAFASLDSVKKLCLDHVVIEDISGLLDMESLKEIKVDSINTTFTAENIDEFRAAGILVTTFSD